MRKIVVSEFVSLDGVMQAPGLADEDRSGGFQHGGWHMGYLDDIARTYIMEGFADTGALLLGRITYEIFAGYWPKAAESEPMAKIINELPKYVVSTTLREPLEWKNSHLISQDVANEVKKLKQQNGKEIQVIGSGKLVQTLMDHQLIDAYRLMIDPVILGGGKHLFRDRHPKTPLRLADHKTSGTGILIATYVPDTARSAHP